MEYYSTIARFEALTVQRNSIFPRHSYLGDTKSPNASTPCPIPMLLSRENETVGLKPPRPSSAHTKRLGFVPSHDRIISSFIVLTSSGGIILPLLVHLPVSLVPSNAKPRPPLTLPNPQRIPPPLPLPFPIPPPVPPSSSSSRLPNLLIRMPGQRKIRIH